VAEFQWYCCQPEPEKGLSTSIALAFAVALGLPIPTAPFDAVWLGVTRSSQGRKSCFDLHFRIEREIIIDPVTELPEEVFVQTDPLWWVEFIAFLTTPEASCTNGCTLKVFP